MGRPDTCSSRGPCGGDAAFARRPVSRERAPLGPHRQGGGPYWLMPVISPHQHVRAIPLPSPAMPCDATYAHFHRINSLLVGAVSCTQANAHSPIGAV